MVWSKLFSSPEAIPRCANGSSGSGILCFVFHNCRVDIDCFFIDLSIRLKKYVIYRVTKLRKGIARVVVIQYPVMGMAWRSYTLLSLS